MDIKELINQMYIESENQHDCHLAWLETSLLQSYANDLQQIHMENMQ